MQTLLHGRRIRGCERCLVELAEDRLRRATRQEDGEPGWRFRIRKALLRTVGSFWSCPVFVAHQLSASVVSVVGLVGLVGNALALSTNPQGLKVGASKQITRRPSARR